MNLMINPSWAEQATPFFWTPHWMHHFQMLHSSTYTEIPSFSHLNLLVLSEDYNIKRKKSWAPYVGPQ